MSQAARLAEMDSRILGVMKRAGLSDQAQYSLGETETQVDVYVDLNAATAGEFGGVSGTQIQIRLLRAQITPQRGARVVVDGPPEVTYELRERLQRDESSEVWLAQRVAI